MQSRRTVSDGDALSPAEEILAKHDAELEAEAEAASNGHTEPTSPDLYCF